MLVELRGDLAQGLLVGLRGLADGLGDHVLLVFLDLLAEAGLVGLAGLDVVGELAVGGARAEGGLAEQVVVGEGGARLQRQGGLDDLPLAGRLDLAGAQQGDDEQADDVELPAEGLLGEFVGEVAAAGALAVAGAVLDAGEDLGEHAVLDVEDRLAALVPHQAEVR